LHLPVEYIDALIEVALARNISYSEIDTVILMGPRLHGKASILVKAEGILAGSDIAKRSFLNVDPSLHVTMLMQDGVEVKPGDIVATVSGFLVSIVIAGRVAISFLQELSGTVSQRAQHKIKTQGHEVNTTNTSRTTPGLSLLKEYEVGTGGNQNHLFHLGNSILIKDNYLTALRALGISSKDIISRAKQNDLHGLKIEVEVNTVQAALDAFKAGADIIILDNMSLEEMRRVVNFTSGQVKTKVSSGTILDNILAIAMAGVDIISIGGVTQSSKALEITLEIEPEKFNLLGTGAKMLDNNLFYPPAKNLVNRKGQTPVL
jgi:nicotinate-nucleotide pyrophosphorylase (carboxylating)